MTIKPVKNENGVMVYHVLDCGCIQEFWTYKEAKDYVDFYNSLKKESE